MELPEKRTEKSKVYRNEGGTETAVVSAGPVHFRDGNGRWIDIDASLTADAAGFRPRQSAAELRFAPFADAPSVVSINLGAGRSVGWAIDGAGHARGELTDDPASPLKGTAVLYRGAFTGVDVRYTSTNVGVKEDIVIAGPDAVREFVFPLRLRGVSARSIDGGVELVDESGTAMARIPNGYMEDSAGDARLIVGARSNDVRVSVVDTAGGPALKVSPDLAWLAAPERVWPVRIDPLVGPLSSNDDTSTHEIYGGDRSGEAAVIVGADPWVYNTWQGHVRFDEANAYLSNRILWATYRGWQYYAFGCQARGLGLYRNHSNFYWNGGGLTGWYGHVGSSVMFDSSYKEWAISGGAGDNCAQVNGQGSGWWNMPLTKYVKTWAGQDGWANNQGITLAVDPDSEYDPYAYRRFSSREMGGQQLHITYTANNAEYSFGSWVTNPGDNAPGVLQVNVKNIGQRTWYAGGTTRLSYHLYDTNWNLITWDGARTYLPVDIAPGQPPVTLSANVGAVPKGDYYVSWDMVEEGVTWFSQEPGVPPANITMRASSTPQFTSALPLDQAEVTTVTPTLSVTVSDPDAWPGMGTMVQFSVCGSTCFSSPWVDSSGGAAQWIVPTGNLGWNMAYSWTATVRERWEWGQNPPGGYGSTFGAASRFATLVPQPVTEAHLGGDSYSSSVAGVNPGIGNLAFSAVDAQVAGPAGGVHITRTYNSADNTTTRVLGLGWTTALDMTLEAGPGTVTLTYPDGSKRLWGVNPNGSYVAAAGYSESLVNEANGVRALRTRGGVHRFDSTGKLISITDPAGRATAIGYVDGRPASMTDSATGRVVTLGWHQVNGRWLLRTASTPSVAAHGGPLTWTYTHTAWGSTALLTKLCGPTPAGQAVPNCTTYTYGQTAGPGGLPRLTRLTLPKSNDQLRAGYQADGTLAWREDGTGKRTTFVHSGAVGLATHQPHAYYRLGEGTGSGAAASDSSGNSRHATYRNFATAAGAAGRATYDADKAAAFDGADDHVQLPSGFADFTSGFSAEAWVYPTAVGAYQRIFDLGNGPSADNIVLYRQGSSSNLTFLVARGGTFRWVEAVNVIEPNAWQHFAVTIGTSGTAVIYKNGHAVASGPLWLPNNVTRTSNFLGRSNWASDAYFAGRMDDVAFYPATLTATQVAALAAGRSTTVTDPAGDAQRLTYDEKGRLVRRADELGMIRTFDYNGFGFVARVVDENANQESYVTDARGNVTSATKSRAGQAITIARSFCVPDSGPCAGYPPTDARLDKMLSEWRADAPDATRTTYAYNGWGQPLTKRQPPTPDAPAGRLTTWTYTTGSETPVNGTGRVPPGLLASSTDAAGRVSSFAYDSSGNVRVAVNPDGVRFEASYDELGRTTTQTTKVAGQPDLTVTVGYDSLSRETSRTEPAVTNPVSGQTHQLRLLTGFDANGNVESVTEWE